MRPLAGDSVAERLGGPDVGTPHPYSDLPFTGKTYSISL